MADKNSVIKQVEDLQTTVQSQVEKSKKSQTTTIIVGVVLAIIILGYFSIMSGKVKELLQPQDLAAMAGDQVVERIKGYRPEVEKAAREQVPALVDDLINEAINNQIPAGREAIEKAIMEESDVQLSAMTDFLLTEFDRIMDDHGDNIKALTETLQTDDGRAEFEEMIYNNINEALNDEEIAINLDAYGQALNDIRDNINMITSTEREDMTELQRATYDLVAIVREMANRSDIDFTKMPGFPGIEEALTKPMSE